ncbi:MAG: DNA replication/repair protein RecF [Hyphomicrobiales bacterium]|nr:DNA replication/repair protein RecF [Hyphomicrobiales bacterium]MBV8824164.1 DNA replication/repair protein RecF [Hyphomicrobiales bacterium]MBV9428862.1 DNA replication/repair protein RecF [Bradyrhizobiaceae bacterium]
MPQPTAVRILRLTLTNFRSYRAASLSVDRDLVVLTGANGAGKTNLLEAISFLAPGRGLRRATLEETAFSEGDGSWAVAAEIEGALGLATLGTGIVLPTDDFTASRQCRVDREPVASAAAFADHLRIVWLTPAMDGLFAGPASERRRFLDRLVLAVDASHSSRVSALERSLRSRNRLLQEPSPDGHWLDAVEHETAEVAIAVAAARAETMQRLAAALATDKDTASPFPWAGIALDGAIENAIGACPASELEDRYRAALRAGRARDATAGRTLEGPHLTDLLVTHGPKQIAAGEASTGEQKALLVGLVLAHAGLVGAMTGITPILLLDEIAAHLDPARREALYERLAGIGAQVWMSGADPAVFDPIASSAAWFDVTPGRAQRRA